ncbi:MAG: YraN family protein [Actinobacteria bacterium]|nr:YraN family protein [Actinomycetota bacterium]
MLPRLRRRKSSPRERPRSTTAIGAAAERQARRFYRLRGYRVLAANVRSGRNEVDLVLRRGRQLVFCEVKAKGGSRFGDPLEMVDREKQRRVRRAAEIWLASHPEAGGLHVRFDVVAVRAGRVQRLTDAF